MDLERLFLTSLSLAAASCGATTVGPDTSNSGAAPFASASDSAAVAPPSSAASAAPSAVVIGSTPTPIDSAEVALNDRTALGYASAFHSIGPFNSAVSGLDILGVADMLDGKLHCDPDGAQCPDEWQVAASDTFARALIVKKRRTVAAIYGANFAEWVGPVDTPEKAALRVRIEPSRTLATCAMFKANGYACAPGSQDEGFAVRVVDKGFEVATYDQRNVCTSGYRNALTIGVSKVNAAGAVTDTSNALTRDAYAKARGDAVCHYPVKGRPFEGYAARPDAERDATIAAYYARSLEEETAAAIAFERLARELRFHGAPEALVCDAEAAARDELSHAARFRAALVEFGDGEPGRPAVDRPLAVRPLIDVLLENAAAGCANETFAALIATHQAAHAPTDHLRALYNPIALEEQRHALLAHRVHQWGLAQLHASDRERVEEAFKTAVATLSCAGATTALGVRLGEPEAPLARAAFTHLIGEIARFASAPPKGTFGAVSHSAN